MAAININVGANTRQAERDIQKLVNRNYNINLSTRGGAPLGRITGQVNEFTKSLDASNARVIAFGASAGIIFGVQRAFGALVTSVIETQKSLADINVILNVSSQNLQKFGGELFNIAKNTGQSFQEVAKAATEFSRQGLGVEETLKRTNEALILSRLSGLDAAKSVEALTAAVNSYASQAVTASEVVNKFANVDAAFAVSSADLAEALARVGSSAAQSGVGLNELIAIVTSAQQTTARGGAVIGNSFKTIFTRLQRTKVIDLLDNLGVNTKDSSGEIKSTINLLTDLAKVYDQLGTLEQADVAEKVGGVFQINILKAALADLGKEYSIYNSALGVAASTTDQAIRRNAELNKTYAAQLNALRENSQQVAAGAGQRVLGPAFDRVVGNANALLGGVNESDGQGIGATLGKGILDGLGQIIAGPGIALIGGVFIKLFADLSKFAGGSLKELLNLNSASKQQQALQESVNQILQKRPDLFKLMSSGTAGLNKGAEILLNNLRSQTLELQKQEAISAKIAAQFIKTGGVRVVGDLPVAPTPGKSGKAGKAAGFIPNFASDKLVEKYTAISLGATSSVRPHMSQGTIDGRKFVMNNQEVEFPGVGKNGDSMVLPTYGDGPSIAAAGFIPNFANFVLNGLKIKDTQMSVLKAGNAININGKNYTAESLGTTAAELKSNPKFLPAREKQRIKNEQKLLKKEEKDIASGRLLASNNEYAAIVASPGEVTPFTQKRFTPQGEALRALKGKGSIKPLNYSFNAYGADNFQESSAKPSFEQIIENNLKKAQQEIVNRYQDTKSIQSQRFTNQKSKSQVSSFAGFLFEDIVASFLKSSEFDSYQKTAPDARFDFKSSKTLQDFFGIPSSIKAVEAKLNTNPSLMTSASNTSSIANKIYAVKGGFALSTPTIQEREEFKKTGQKKLKAAAGYIPNFAAQAAAEKREMSVSGSPAVPLYSNMLGSTVVVNEDQIKKYGPNADKIIKKDHINKGQVGTRSNLMKTGSGKEKYKASGFIPNFAAEDTAPTNIGSSIAALTTQLGGLALMLSFSKGQYQTALAELTSSTKAAAFAQRSELARNIRERRNLGAPNEAIKQSLVSERANARQSAQVGFAGKAGAAIGTNALVLSLLGPILAETAANLIGKEDKTSRVGSSGASALGQAATFAGFGAMLTPAMPLLGAGIGAAAGGLLGLVDVIKQASTDIPELSAAAQKASENLTKINDAGQRVQTSFEQIQGLRESGQGEKAGQLENELLSLIGKEFKDTPELVSGARTAVINQDFVSLQKVLGENTNAILKNTLAKEQELLAVRFAEGFGGEDSSNQFADLSKIGDISLEGLQGLQNILNQPRDIKTTVGGGAGGMAVVQTIDNSIFEISEQIRENLNKYSKSFASLPIEFQNQIIETIRQGDVKDISKFLEELGKSIKNGISIQEAINRNSAINNKVIDLITKTLQKVQSNYAILAKQSQASLDLGLFRDSQARVSSTNMRVAETGSQAVIDEVFGVTTPSGKADKVTEGALIKINEDFSNGIQTSIDGVLSLIGSAFLEQNAKSFAALSEIGTGDGAQANAEANLAAAENLARQFGENFSVEKFRDILATGAVGTEGGFDPDKIVSKIAEEFKIDTSDSKSAETLESIRQALDKTNQEVIKSQVILREQKTILANQKFQENLRALVASVQGAFGGLTAFLADDVTVTSEIQKALANIEIIGEPTGEKSTIEVGRNLARVNAEFSKLTGVNLNNVLGGEFVEKQTEARALDINQSLSPIISNIAKTLGPEAARKATKDLGAQAGLTDEELKSLSIDQILARVSKTFAEVQIGTGKTDEALIQRAKDQLPPELRGLLDGGGVRSLEQVTVAQLSTANQTLQQILAAIQANANSDEIKVARFLQDPLRGGNTFKPNQDNALDRLAPVPKKPFPTFAAGYIPPKAAPAIIQESIDIANGVGGALPTDRPKIERNFNGKTVVRGTGEIVKKNYMGTGEDAILTREMQNMAEGYLPSLISEDSRARQEAFFNNPGRELYTRIQEIQSKLGRLPKPGEFGYKDGDNVRRRELEKELALLQDPKAVILDRDGEKRNPYFDENGKYIARKKKKPKIKNPFENMAEGSLPSLISKDSRARQEAFFNNPERELYTRIQEIRSKLRSLPKPGEFGYKDGDNVRRRELEKELALLQDPKAVILDRDGEKRNPYFDENGKYIARKKKKSKIKNPFENMAEGSIPDKKYLMGRTAMSKATKNLNLPTPVSPILKGVGGVMGRLANPIGLASSAYSFMDNFGGLPWSDKSKKPKEMSPKDMPDYLKEYRTGPRPKFSNFAEGSLPSVNIEGDVNEDLFRQLGRGLSGGSVDFNKRIGKVENKAAGDIPFVEGDFGPETKLPYDLIKRANELNRKYGQKMDPIEDTYSRNRKYQSALQDEEKKNFFDYLNKTKGYSSTQSEEIWNDTLKSTGNVRFGEEEAAKLKDSYGWTSPVRNEIEKTDDAQNILSTELRKIQNEFKYVSHPLKQQFENIGADSGDFLNPNRGLQGLFSNEREFNRLRGENKLFRQQNENARVAAKRREQIDRKNAKTQDIIQRSREVLAKSYEITGDRYDIVENSDGSSTRVDRAGLESPTVIPTKKALSARPGAQFMLQTLVEAYTKSLSAQEKGRPTGAKMDQKRAIMAKIQEFKRLYEQGKYQSLEAIYNKHQKSDPVKDAYASYEAKGIDPNAGYDAAMRAVGLNPETGAPDYSPVSQGSRIDGRPAEEVLAEGRANRPSDPAYDAAMRAVGLDPKTGAPDVAHELAYMNQGGLIDGIPAQERLDELTKENASRTKTYAQGFVPKMDSFMNEMSAGFNPSEIYLKKQPELQGLNNPQGDAYFNKPEEGTTAKERIAMGNRMNIPGFANSIPESAPASINLGGLTINEAQTGGKSKEYSADFAKDWETKASALALQIKGELDQKYGRAMEIVAAGERKGSLPRVPPKSRGLVA